MTRTLRVQRERRRWWLVVAAILVVAWSYWTQSEVCSASQTNEAQAMSSFANKIRSIEEQIVDLTWPGGLFEYQEFRKIYDNPASYFSEVSEALKSPDFTEQQKIMIGLSMQGINLPQFLSFAKYTLRLLESGAVSQKVFEHVVFPTYDWNTKIVENYEKHDVAQFLQSVLESKEVGDRRKEIIRKEVLTGKAKSYVLDKRQAGKPR